MAKRLELQVVVPVNNGGSPIMSPHTPGGRRKSIASSPGSVGSFGSPISVGSGLASPSSPRGGVPSTGRRPKRVVHHRKNISVLSISQAADVLGNLHSGDVHGAGVADPDKVQSNVVFDCGRLEQTGSIFCCNKKSKRLPFDLSYSKVVEEANLNHPRIVNDDGSLKMHKMCSTTAGGHNPIPFCSNPRSDFEKYGVGVVLYFKFVKFMIILGFLMCLVATPAGLFYFYANDPSSTTDYSFLNYLELNTIGNLGEGTPIFANLVEEGGTVSLACPGATDSIGSISVAYFGQFNGTIHCPSNQKQDTSGKCSQGKINYLEKTSTGAYKCEPNPNPLINGGDSAYCYTGILPPLNEPCCANGQTGDGYADFTPLRLRPNPKCNSNTIQSIVNGLCLQENSCSFKVSSTTPYTWLPTTETLCPNPKDTTCSATLLPLNNNCTVGVPNRMTIVASCFSTLVQFPYLPEAFAKTTILNIISIIDVGGCFLFLLAVSFLASSEKTDIDTLNASNCTANDYSLLLPRLPKHLNVIQLHEAIKQHFESIINDYQYELYVGQWDRSIDKKLTVADINFTYKKQTKAIALLALRGAVLEELDPYLTALAQLRELPTTVGLDGVSNFKNFDDADLQAPQLPPAANLQAGPHLAAGNVNVENPMLAVKNVAVDGVFQVDVNENKKESSVVTPLSPSGAGSGSDTELNKDDTNKHHSRGLSVEDREKMTKSELSDLEKKEKADKALLKTINRLQVKLSKIDKELDSFEGKNMTGLVADKCFITFNEEEGVMRCKNIYPSSYISYLFQPQRLRMVDVVPLKEGKDASKKKATYRRIRVAEAMNPGDIFWENMDMEETDRARRECITLFLTIIILAVSFFGIIYAQSEQSALKRKYFNVDCTQFPNITKRDVVIDQYPEYFNNLNGDQGKLTCFCKNELYSPLQTTKNNIFNEYFVNMKDLGPTNSANVSTSLLAYFYNQTSQLTINSSESWNNWDDKAYQDLWGGTNINGTNHGLLLCSTWWLQSAESNAIQYGSLVLVIAINIILKKVLKRFVKFEAQNSRSAEDASFLIKLFVAQLFNTAILVLIVNWNLNEFASSGYFKLPNGFPIFGGDYSNFDVAWYTNIGVQLIITMVGFIPQVLAGPLLQKLSMWYSIHSDRHWKGDVSLTKKKTQTELERLHTGPDFQLVQRYSAHLTMIFVCFTYSTGIPTLLIVSFIYFFLTYFIDKWCFLTMYTTPPMYDGKIAMKVSSILPLALFLHLTIGSWMYGNPKIFQSSTALQKALEASAKLAAGNSTLSGNTTTTTDNGIFSVISSGVSLILNDLTAYNTEASFTLENILTNVPVVAIFYALYVVWLVWHYFLSELLAPFTKLFICCRKKEELQGYPDYFEALPYAYVKKSIVSGSVKPELMISYAESLGSRVQEQNENKNKRISMQSIGELYNKKDEAVSRSMNGLPSYDINDNTFYRNSFGHDLFACKEFVRRFPRILTAKIKKEKEDHLIEKKQKIKDFVGQHDNVMEIFFDIFQDAAVDGKVNSHGEPVINTKQLLACMISKVPNNDLWLAQLRVAQIFSLGDTEKNGYLTERDLLYAGAVLYPNPTIQDLNSFKLAFGKRSSDAPEDFNLNIMDDETLDKSFGMSGVFKPGVEGDNFVSVTNAGLAIVNGVYRQIGLKHGSLLMKNDKDVILCREYSPSDDRYFWVFGKHPNVYYIAAEKFMNGYPPVYQYHGKDGKAPYPFVHLISREDAAIAYAFAHAAKAIQDIEDEIARKNTEFEQLLVEYADSLKKHTIVEERKAKTLGTSFVATPFDKTEKGVSINERKASIEKEIESHKIRLTALKEHKTLEDAELGVKGVQRASDVAKEEVLTNKLMAFYKEFNPEKALLENCKLAAQKYLNDEATLIKNLSEKYNQEGVNRYFSAPTTRRQESQSNLVTDMAFDFIDLDHSGKIDFREIIAAAKLSELDLTTEQLSSLMDGTDTDGDGKINKKEFYEAQEKDPSGLLSKLAAQVILKHQLHEKAFAMMDIRKIRKLSIQDIIKSVKDLKGFNLSVDDLHDAITVADKDKDDHINFEEFRESMMKSPTGLIATVAKRLTENYTETEELFSLLDVENKGTINFKNIVNAAKALNVSLTTDEIDAMYTLADPTGTGTVNKDQLAKALQDKSPKNPWHSLKRSPTVKKE